MDVLRFKLISFLQTRPVYNDRELLEKDLVQYSINEQKVMDEIDISVQMEKLRENLYYTDEYSLACYSVLNNNRIFFKTYVSKLHFTILDFILEYVMQNEDFEVFEILITQKLENLFLDEDYNLKYYWYLTFKSYMDYISKLSLAGKIEKPDLLNIIDDEEMSIEINKLLTNIYYIPDLEVENSWNAFINQNPEFIEVYGHLLMDNIFLDDLWTDDLAYSLYPNKNSSLRFKLFKILINSPAFDIYGSIEPMLRANLTQTEHLIDEYVQDLDLQDLDLQNLPDNLESEELNIYLDILYKNELEKEMDYLRAEKEIMARNDFDTDPRRNRVKKLEMYSSQEEL